jgi:GDP-L-fucose synthase
MREFLHVDDCAAGIVFLLENYSDMAHVNLGTGQDVTITELAETIKSVVGFDGGLVFDPSKPDGTPRKLLDTSKINALGWHPAISLHDGLTSTYQWFLENN